MGFITSTAVCLGLGIGAMSCGPPAQTLPPRIEGCRDMLPPGVDMLEALEDEALWNQTFLNTTALNVTWPMYGALAMSPQKELALAPPAGVIATLTQTPPLMTVESW